MKHIIPKPKKPEKTDAEKAAEAKAVQNRKDYALAAAGDLAARKSGIRSLYGDDSSLAYLGQHDRLGGPK